MLQRFLAATIIQEWAVEVDSKSPFDPPPPLTQANQLATEMATRLVDRITAPAPPTYHEMLPDLNRIAQECRNLLGAFLEGKVPKDKVPSLPNDLDINGDNDQAFSIATAEKTIQETFVALRSLLPKGRRKDNAQFEDKRVKIMAMVERYKDVKKVYDIRVMAAVAAATVALRTLPDKKNPIVHGIMDGTKV